MPENKRTFKVGNDIYDIDESQVSEFTKDAPDAIEVKSFLVEKDTFDIPLSDVDGFLKDVPNAKPLFNETTGEGKRTAKGAISGALGKLQVEPTKSGGSGSATKRTPLKVELQSQFPTNLQADQTQELIESNIQGAELAGLDYEAISKQMAGKSPIDVAFEQVNKIQDPEEKFNTTRSLYKLAINDVSDANTNIRGNVEQMEQGMLQMQEQYEQGLNQYNEYLQQGDKETANLLAQDLNQQQENIKLAATQYEDLVKEYNDNAKFLGILNAGRAANYQTAKGQKGLTAGKLPIGAAMFSNMIGGTTMQFSPEETMAASAWNAITPNLVRTLASGIEIADYFVRPGSLESTNLSKMAGDALLDFANDIEVETEKFVPKGTELNIFKELNPYSAGQFAGSLIGSVAGSIGSGGLAGTGKAAMVFNAAQGYGGMYGWGKEAGLSSAEASALAAPVGLVYGYLGDKGVESLASVVGRESFKKIVLKGIKELGKDKTPKALSEVFLKSLQEFGKNTVKGAVKESLQEGAEFSSEFWTKRLAVETGLAKTEDDLTFDAFMSGLEDSMKGGALGGGLLGGLLGASPRRTLATVVSESVNDPIKEQEFMDNMNALLNGTQIDQQQYDEVMQMYNRAKEVNNTVPSNVTNEQARAEAIDLIQERDDLQAQVEVIDPAMAKPFNDRVEEINSTLEQIAFFNEQTTSQEEDTRTWKEKSGLKSIGEIVAEQKAKKERDERLKTGKQLFDEQKKKGEQIRLRKEEEAKQEAIEQRQQRDREVEEIAKIRPDLTADDLILGELSEGFDVVMNRMDLGIPTDVVAIDEAISELDRKFDEINEYRNNPKRTHTDAQINEVVDLLDAAKTELQYYKEAVIDDESTIEQRRKVEGIAETPPVQITPTAKSAEAQVASKPEAAPVQPTETIEQPQVETRKEPVLGDVESKIQQASMIKDAAKRKKALDEIFNSEEYKQFVESTEEELNNNKTKVAEGNGSWRKAFNETSDAMRKKDILRAIADVSTDKTELNDVLDAAKGLPKGLQSEINNAVKQKLESLLSKEQTPPALKDVESRKKEIKSENDKLIKRKRELANDRDDVVTSEGKYKNFGKKERDARLEEIRKEVKDIDSKQESLQKELKIIQSKETGSVELFDHINTNHGSTNTIIYDIKNNKLIERENVARGKTKDISIEDAAKKKFGKTLRGRNQREINEAYTDKVKTKYEAEIADEINKYKTESLLSKEQTPTKEVAPALRDVESAAKKSEIAKRIRDNIKDLPEKDLGDAEANKNWNDIRESRKTIKAMSDVELLKEVQKGMDGKLINQAIYESYIGMDITAKDIAKEIESLLSKEQEAQGQQEVENITPTTNEEGTIEERPDQEVLLEGVQETRNENEVGQVGEQLRTQEEVTAQEEVDPFAALEQVANELEKAAQDEAKKKSFSSQMNNIVDRIDKLIDDIDNSNIALSSIPFARQIARTALKIFRDAFDAAGRTPEAFRKAMQEMRDALSRDADYKNLDRQQQAELIKDLSNEILDKNPFNFQGDERVSKFASRVSKIYANVNDVYTSQSQEKVRQEVIALIDELGLDVVLEYAESAGVPSGVKTAILGEAFGRAKAAFDANPTPENRKAFNEATERLKQWGTDAGQGVAYFNKIYELFPELQVEQFQEDLNKQTEDNLGNQGKKKVERIKQETVRIKKDLFNALSNVLNGKLDAIELFSRNILSDERLKKGISKLVNIAGKLNDSDKKKMSELFERLRNSGKLELENTIKEVRPLIYEGLKSINPSLQTTLSEQQISDIADEFAKVYEDIATNMLTDFINREFQDSKKSGQQEKNGKVARLILQGVLDNPSTLNAFAQKFGIPSITPQQASQLRTLAQRVNQSKGGQKAAAQRQLTIYINGLKKAANSVFARQMQRVGDATNDLGSLIINNILFGVTAGFAYISNLTRTIGAAIGSLVKGEPDAIKFALKEGMNQQFTLPNGQVIDLKLRPVRDAILAATSGIPRLSEYLLAGISDQEMKIRQAKTRTERIARRIFLTASMRLYSAVDASVVPYYKAMTKYSIMKKLILQMYKDNKQPKPSKVDLDKQVRGLIGLDVTNFDAIVERAYENTMNSTLVDDLVAQGAWNKNNPMPDASSRNNPNSAAAQVYNEFITNIYELHESDFYNRFLELQNSKDNLGNDIFDTGKAGMYARMLKDVDRILAKNTNEMAFYGRPSGFEGQMYDVLISINNKVPGLKYSGYSPLFVGAAMNGAAYARKTYPVVNAISYAYYKAAGKRISDFGNDGEFETDFGLKVDQNNMLQTVVSSTIAMAGIAAWLFSRYDTPEEEEQALKDRNWSGYVNDLNFAQSQSFFDRNGNKLQKGFLYINGYPAMPVYRLPFFGMFEAAGFLKNYGTLTQSKKSEDLFKDEEEEERYKGVLGAYLLNGYLLSLRLSQTKELSESITKILSATPDDLGGSTSEKVQKDFENKMSRLAANLIPFNQAQRQIADLFVNAEGGYNRKVASTFAEKIAMQTAFQHWMVKSNMVDPFGRPIPEVFDVRGLTLGFNMFEFDKNGNIYTFLDKAYAGDKYMKLHLDKEYVYTSNHTKIIPVTVELEGEGIDVPAAKKIVKELKESGVEAQLPEKAMGTLTTDEVKYYTYNMELDDDEINIMNEEAAKQVKKLVDEPGNYQVLSNPELTKRAYRQFMDKAYKYSTTLQVYKMHSKELGEAYLNTVKKQYKNLQNDPIVKELGLVIPSGWSID
jgi:hypothetical protein